MVLQTLPDVSGGCGKVEVVGWKWSGGCGRVEVVGWMWSGGSGRVEVVGWKWSGGSGRVECVSHVKAFVTSFAKWGLKLQISS